MQKLVKLTSHLSILHPRSSNMQIRCYTEQKKHQSHTTHPTLFRWKVKSNIDIILIQTIWNQKYTQSFHAVITIKKHVFGRYKILMSTHGYRCSDFSQEYSEKTTQFLIVYSESDSEH